MRPRSGLALHRRDAVSPGAPLRQRHHHAWTGTKADGSTDVGHTCADWTDGTAGHDGSYGNPNVTDSAWIDTPRWRRPSASVSFGTLAT